MLQTKGFQNVIKYLRGTVLRRKLTYFSYVFDRVLNKPLRDNFKTLFMVGKISRKTEILRNVSRHKFDKYFLSQKVYYVKNFLILVNRFDKRLVLFLMQFSLFLFHIFVKKCFENCSSLPFKTLIYRLIFFPFFFRREFFTSLWVEILMLTLVK